MLLPSSQKGINLKNISTTVWLQQWNEGNVSSNNATIRTIVAEPYVQLVTHQLAVSSY